MTADDPGRGGASGNGDSDGDGRGGERPAGNADANANHDPPRDASLPPGYDERDPYEGEDLATYPAWWRHNVEEFRAHGMRPYRPPRLADGTLSPPLLADLRERFDAEVRFRSVDPQSGGSWELVVDDEPVATVEHRRHGEGYTVYDVTAEEVRRLVRAATG
ncbi:MAG: hypothetical protein ABEJ61_05315 [Haloferacaceae archaeon]